MKAASQLLRIPSPSELRNTRTGPESWSVAISKSTADSEAGKMPSKQGSATVSVAPVGVPPTGFGCVEDGAKWCVCAPRECFRRDAENCGPDARAPHFY